MAKPCRYRLPGQDTWMSEDEFKKSLADGLLDKFAIDDKIAVRNFKPDATAAEKFRAPITETAPQAEVKREDSGVTLNGKKLTIQEAIDLYKEDIKELESKERTLSVDKQLDNLYESVRKLEARQAPKAQEGVLTKGDLNRLTPNDIFNIYDGLSNELKDKHFHYGVSGVNQPTNTRFLSKLRNAVGQEEAIRLIKEKVTPKQQAEVTPTETTQAEVAPTAVTEKTPETKEEKITVNPSQGYSFTYESEKDIPSGLKGVTPINRSESTVGRGRQAKTNIRLTFSGQQLIDAGVGQVSPTETKTEAAPVSDKRAEIEANKADIERRRQERLKPVSEENPKGYFENTGIYKKDKVTGEEYYDPDVKNGTYSVDFSEDEDVDDFIDADSIEELKSKINAKYDAELTALEQQPTPVAETKAEPTAKAEIKESGYSPTDNIINKPELTKNKTHGWRTMSEEEFNSLSTGEKNYEGGAPKSGNWISGIPESAAKFGKKGAVMVEFGGIKIEGAENMEKGSKADKSNVTKVWKFNNDTKKFEEAPELLDKVKKSEKIEAPTSKAKTADQLRSEADDIFDNQIPNIKGFSPEFYGVVDVRNNNIYTSYVSSKERLNKEGINLDELLSESDKSKLKQIEQLQQKAERLYDKADDVEYKPAKEPKPTTEKVERKGAVEVEAETKRGTKVTYKAELSEDGKTASVQQTYEAPFGGQTEGPRFANLPVKTDANGNRYVETKNETRVYIDRVKEAPKAKEAPVKEEVEGKGKPTKVKIYAREPKLDDRGMPIISKFNQEVEFTKNKRTGKWETTDKAGNKIEATEDQAERAEKALAGQQKQPKTTKDKISDAFDSLKIDTKGKTFSTLIPPGAINRIIELTKRLVLSGYDVVSAVNEATSQVIDKLKSNKLISDEQAKEIADFTKSDDFINGAKKASEGEIIEPLSSVKKSNINPIAQKLFEKSNKRLTDQEWINLGKEAIESGTIKPKKIIDEINSGDRDLMDKPLNMLEQVSLMVYNKQIDTNIQNKKADLSKPGLNEKKRNSIEKEIFNLQDEKFNLQLVLAESNYQKGWSLQFNRAMIDNDYNAEFQINSYKANNVNGNNQIPKEVEEKFRELEAIIKENERKLAEREAEIQKLQDNQLMDDLKASVKNKNKVVTESKFTVSADGKIKVPTSMIREFVEGGVKTIEELTDKVMEKFKAENPGVDVSERQIRDAITGYGITVNMSQDEISAAISEMKDVGRKISELEDLDKGIKKAKNEAKRKELTDRQRYLKLSIQQALDALPLSVDEKETIEANRLETYKRRQKSTLVKLNYLNDNKIFAKKQAPNPVKMDKQAKDLANKIRLAKDEFDAEQQKLEYQNTSLGQKIKNAIMEGLLVGKSLTLGGDLSSVRQAAPLIVNLMFTDPKSVINYLVNMHKLAGLVPKVNPFTNPKQYVKDFIDGITNENIGEKLYQEMQAELKNSEDYDLIKKSGLFLTEENAKLKAREESFQSHFVKFIPFAGKPIKLKNGKTIVPGLDLFGRGERSFAAMNELRIKMFLNEVKSLEKVGITWETSPDTIKQIASVINTLGGRGEGGRLFETIAPYLNFPLVSARFAKSRWDMTVLNPMAHYKIMKMTPAARKFAYKKMLSLHTYLAFMAGAAYLYANSDDDDEVKFGLNPTSTDFLKLKIGKNTSFDFNLGLQQLNRVALQLGYGKVTYANGEEVELNSQYAGPTYASVFSKYFLNKTNPMVGDAIKWSMGIKKDGDAKKSEEGIERYYLPMSYTLAKELGGEEDISTTDKVLGNLLSFYGISNVDVYQPYQGPVRSLTNYDDFEKDLMEVDSFDDFEKEERKLLEGF